MIKHTLRRPPRPADATAAVAQTFPTVPAHPVIGRLGTPGTSARRRRSVRDRAVQSGRIAGRPTWFGLARHRVAWPHRHSARWSVPMCPQFNLAAASQRRRDRRHSIANGGSAGATKQAGSTNLAPTATRAGDIAYWNARTGLRSRATTPAPNPDGEIVLAFHHGLRRSVSSVNDHGGRGNLRFRNLRQSLLPAPAPLLSIQSVNHQLARADVLLNNSANYFRWSQHRAGNDRHMVGVWNSDS